MSEIFTELHARIADRVVSYLKPRLMFTQRLRGISNPFTIAEEQIDELLQLIHQYIAQFGLEGVDSTITGTSTSDNVFFIRSILENAKSKDPDIKTFDDYRNWQHEHWLRIALSDQLITQLLHQGSIETNGAAYIRATNHANQIIFEFDRCGNETNPIDDLSEDDYLIADELYVAQEANMSTVCLIQEYDGKTSAKIIYEVKSALLPLAAFTTFNGWLTQLGVAHMAKGFFYYGWPEIHNILSEAIKLAKTHRNLIPTEA